MKTDQITAFTIKEYLKETRSWFLFKEISLAIHLPLCQSITEKDKSKNSVEYPFKTKNPIRDKVSPVIAIIIIAKIIIAANPNSNPIAKDVFAPIVSALCSIVFLLLRSICVEEGGIK